MQQIESRKELYRRLPEIRKIRNQPLQEKVADAFIEHCPDYFWTAPASSSGNYHQPDVCGEHGLWLHVKRTFTAYERLARSYQHQGMITEMEADYGRAAILLHDIFKYGKPPRGKHTVDDHDKVAARILRQNTDLPEEVIQCIDSHNGPWYEGKTPETDLEQIHHLADMIGSCQNGYFSVYKPCDELEEIIEEEPSMRADLS